MQNTILIVHVVFGLLFVLAVLIQDKGTGLSATFGGSGGFYASQRGAAKVVHYATIIFALIFFASALLFIVFPKSVSDPGLQVTPLTEGVTVDPGAIKVETEPIE